ncbi:11321_t:CDS:1, partial [Gigaspora rosea]
SWYKKEEGIKDRMGSAWVQLDRKEEIVSLVGKIRVVDWPSLTRSEIVAILCTLLVVKSDSLVVVKTD